MDVSMLKEEYKPAISLLNIILKKRLTGIGTALFICKNDNRIIIGSLDESTG
jgi:hypothetical protein